MDQLSLKTIQVDGGEEVYLTMKEAAAFLKISISSMEKLSHMEVIEKFRPRHKVYFSLRALRSYIESGFKPSKKQIELAALDKMQNQKNR